MSLLTNLITELKARSVRKTMTIYFSSALTAIGVTKLLVEVYNIPERIFPVVVTLLLCGVVSAFIFAWFHGKEGGQKFRKRELGLHVLVIGLAVFISFRVGGTPPRVHLKASDKSIAVLPFKNMSDNKEDEYFSDGIMEDILTQLSKIGDLRVVSRTSVMKYKDTEKNMREIGSELGVAVILEGSVRRNGNQLRIDSRLINAETDENMWANTYDREMKDIFAIQSDVAQRIAGELKAHLSPGEVARVKAEPTRNLEAYALFLRARDYRNRRNNHDNEQAIELLKKALALDSAYALAHAELGMAYIARYLAHGYPSVWADSGIAHGQRAIALDPSCAEGYHTIGKGYEGLGKFSLALQSYNKAIELNPNYANAVASIGWVAFGVGKIDEALEWMRKSVDLDPAVASRYVGVGTMYNYLEEDSLAVQWYRKALKLDKDLVLTYWYLSYFYLYDGNIDVAKKYITLALEKSPTDFSFLHAAGDIELIKGNIPSALSYFKQAVESSSLIDGPGNQLAFALLKIGKQKEANDILDSNLVAYKRLSEESPEDFNNPVAVATIYAIQNKQEEALTWLRLAVERGAPDARWYMVEPLFANLRTNPGFRDIINTIRARITAMHVRAQERGLLK